MKINIFQWFLVLIHLKYANFSTETNSQKKINFQSSNVNFDLETALKYNRNVDDDTAPVNDKQSLLFTEFACKLINNKDGEINLLNNNDDH
jgi:hypothetical protein